MLAIALAEAWLEKFGGDSLVEVRRNYEGYLAALAPHAAEDADS
jgi:chorismate synthase